MQNFYAKQPETLDIEFSPGTKYFIMTLFFLSQFQTMQCRFFPPSLIQ